MELLLTPVVNNLLACIIKSADGTSGSRLRVSLSRGSVVLHHLELNLDRYSFCVHLNTVCLAAKSFSATDDFFVWAKTCLQAKLHSQYMVSKVCSDKLQQGYPERL